ncbi:suppressor of fused domain protein [Stenotrophomonas maltophilia]|uniref:suppressor of fused domain protein n=1 Tax=Stenotrophomonas maltophilia TaxID=40324 RepID=UPI003CCF5C2E
MSTIDDDTLLERSWEYREETLYRRLFGDTGPGIYPLDMDLLRNVFKQEQIDPRWLHVGVNACPPHGDRRHWIYVSTGLSNPWEGRHEDGDSGWGIELMLETQEEATWALTTLRWFTAYHLLLCHSRMPGNPLAPWDRLKLGGAGGSRREHAAGGRLRSVIALSGTPATAIGTIRLPAAAAVDPGRARVRPRAWLRSAGGPVENPRCGAGGRSAAGQHRSGPCSRTSIASGLALRDRIISNPASICADSGSVAGVQRAPRHA